MSTTLDQHPIITGDAFLAWLEGHGLIRPNDSLVWIEAHIDKPVSLHAMSSIDDGVTRTFTTDSRAWMEWLAAHGVEIGPLVESVTVKCNRAGLVRIEVTHLGTAALLADVCPLEQRL